MIVYFNYIDVSLGNVQCSRSCLYFVSGETTPTSNICIVNQMNVLIIFITLDFRSASGLIETITMYEIKTQAGSRLVCNECHQWRKYFKLYFVCLWKVAVIFGTVALSCFYLFPYRFVKTYHRLCQLFLCHPSQSATILINAGRLQSKYYYYTHRHIWAISISSL